MAKPADFDPYSEQVIEHVNLVEALPTLQSFHQLMYDRRFERKAVYGYQAPSPESGPEPSPASIHIPYELLSEDRFPAALRAIFPDIDYSIDELRIVQTETKDLEDTPQTSLSFSFLANEKPYLISGLNDELTYETIDEDLQKVRYPISPEQVRALLSLFVYSTQYDPQLKKQIVDVHDNILVNRDPSVGWTEQMIMTLGQMGGFASIHTAAIFENPAGGLLSANLFEAETPGSSVLDNQLEINEIDTIDDLTTATSTTLYNMDAKQQKASKKYAEQKSTVLKGAPITASVRIQSNKKQYPQWARLCDMFANIVKGPLDTYLYLDDDIDDDTVQESTEEPL